MDRENEMSEGVIEGYVICGRSRGTPYQWKNTQVYTKEEAQKRIDALNHPWTYNTQIGPPIDYWIEKV